MSNVKTKIVSLIVVRFYPKMNLVDRLKYKKEICSIKLHEKLFSGSRAPYGQTDVTKL